LFAMISAPSARGSEWCGNILRPFRISSECAWVDSTGYQVVRPHSRSDGSGPVFHPRISSGAMHIQSLCDCEHAFRLAKKRDALRHVVDRLRIGKYGTALNSVTSDWPLTSDNAAAR